MEIKMNFHSDEYIQQELEKHYEEALKYFDEEHIVGIFLQGSQNYGLDVDGSDIDTKLIVTPTLKEIVRADNPISTTHIMDNDEHIDFKDVRLYIKTFLKQNPNFLEILFTRYFYINPLYKDLWMQLVEHREAIARYDIVANVKAIRGVALEKYHSMEHRYPSKLDIIDKYGYDPKQLHHLLRMEGFLVNYLKGISYEGCLIPDNYELLAEIKSGLYGGKLLYSLEEARKVADESLNHIETLYNNADSKNFPEKSKYTEELLFNVQSDIIERSIINELERKGSL